MKIYSLTLSDIEKEAKNFAIEAINSHIEDNEIRGTEPEIYYLRCIEAIAKWSLRE